MLELHFGVDEREKGDFFEPLVISGVYVDRGIARKLVDAGVQDSKWIGSDARIRALGETIRKAAGGLVETVLIGPPRYNQLYEKFGNLNKLLGWGHARVIENLLGKKLVDTSGPQALREVAKVHFRTAYEIAPNHYAVPPSRENWRKNTQYET